jgi:hypothetical protein
VHVFSVKADFVFGAAAGVDKVRQQFLRGKYERERANFQEGTAVQVQVNESGEFLPGLIIGYNGSGQDNPATSGNSPQLSG